MGAGGVIRTSSEVEARRYRIVSVLGKGGVGKVYRAVLELPGGAQRDVAVKLLRADDLTDAMLARFRDQGRALGAVRDPAIVVVEPPVRVGDKWAVVAPYVDGASLQRLMSMGPLPAAVAAQVTQEVARVLDKVYRSPGPDGEPLKILHRDVKPSNLQITAAGEVKVLDFGMVKDLGRTEERTTGALPVALRDRDANAYAAGTRGFVAPERLEGNDSAAGDVYSLGVTLHVMVVGERPAKRGRGQEEPATQNMSAEALAMVSLSARMRSADPKERPTAKEVEEACARVRRKSDGPTLEEWAGKCVPRAVALKFSDEVVGTVLIETLDADRDSDERLGAELVQLEPGRKRPSEAPRSAPKSVAPGRPKSAEPPKDSAPRPSVAPPRPEPPKSVAPPRPEPPRSVVPPAKSVARPEPPKSVVPPRPESPKSVAPPRPEARSTSKSVAPRADEGRVQQARIEPIAARVEPQPEPRPEPRAEARAEPKLARSLQSTVPMSDRLDLEATHVPPELPGDLTVSPVGVGFEPTVALRPVPGPGASVEAAHVEEPHGSGMWMGLAAMGTLVGGGLGAVTLVLLISLFFLGSSLLDPGFGNPNLPLGIAPPTALPRLTIDLLPRPDELVTPDFAPTPAVGGQLADDLPLPPGADPTRDVTFSSVPIGADVYLDGRLVGQTPLVGFPLTEGDHQVKMITDAETLIRGIAVGRRKPGRYVWKGGDLWEVHP